MTDAARPLDAADAPSPDDARDTGAPVDATPDASIDAPEASLRLLAPLSTARVTSRRPTLHWVLPTGITAATVDLCHDRACTNPIGTAASVTGASYAPTADLPTGVVYWRIHAGTSTSATWQLTVGARTAPVDTSWGTTLDVNGDGYADVAIAAVSGDILTGTVYVYLGSATGLGATPVTLTSPLGGYFGSSLASAGDVNGDGYADLVVGSNGERGSVSIFLGGASGLSTVAATTLVSPLGADAGTAADEFGVSVAGAGDVNGDGYADIVVGAGGGTSTTNAYVYLGSASGIPSSPSLTLTAPAGLVSYSYFGLSVAGAGDVNGDGLGDVLIGAPGANDTFLYLGTAGGLDVSPTTLAHAPLPDVAGTFGDFVASAGDVNGDGYADIAITPGASTNDTGIVYVFLGSATGVASTPAVSIQDGTSNTHATTFNVPAPSAGDVNGDGYSDLIVGKPGEGTSDSGIVYVYLGGPDGLATTPTNTLASPFGAHSYFGVSVASAGDITGDGYSDIVIGAVDAPGVLLTGNAILYSGSMNGLLTTPLATLASPGPDGFGWQVFGASN